MDANATLYGIQRGLKVRYELDGKLDGPHEDLLKYYASPDEYPDVLMSDSPSSASKPIQQEEVDALDFYNNEVELNKIMKDLDGPMRKPTGQDNGKKKENKELTLGQAKLEDFYASLPPGVRGEITDDDADVVWSTENVVTQWQLTITEMLYERRWEDSNDELLTSRIRNGIRQVTLNAKNGIKRALHEFKISYAAVTRLLRPTMIWLLLEKIQMLRMDWLYRQLLFYLLTPRSNNHWRLLQDYRNYRLQSLQTRCT